MTTSSHEEIQVRMRGDSELNGNSNQQSSDQSVIYSSFDPQQPGGDEQNGSGNSQSNQQWFNKSKLSQKMFKFRPLEGTSQNDAVIDESRREKKGISLPTWGRKIQYFFCCLPPGNVDYTSAEFEDGMESEGKGMGDGEGGLQYLIGPIKEEDQDKKTLVLDLDETLVHSSFKPVINPDYVIPVEVEGAMTDVYVLRRPHLDYFMKQVCSTYEVIVFTASLSKYADPLLDLLDEHSMVRWRLFREACVHFQGTYVKDLTKLGRELRNVIIVDNSPNSYIFQPENAIPIRAFMDDMEDRALLELLPLLQDLSTKFDVRDGLKEWQNQLTMASQFGAVVQNQ
eukprot:TRINITY_DN1256_c0_g4_i1.p3 TRINITY_DN1256_c0_g4~~TRINITY_DN1256_c0_g4_i1.p3  ORF type:complete len:340 (+),score=55.98 TRINITY_DN1256_c0_g4_i1:306-1325(+)